MDDNLERIEATRDLLGSFSVFLDEFTACWGGLRIAGDHLRARVLLDVIEHDGAREAFALWIEAHLEGEHAELIAPLASLLWSSGGSTEGAVHAYEVTATPSAEPGARQLASALGRAATFAQARESARDAGSPSRARASLAAAASNLGLVGLPADVELALEEATGELWAEVFDAYGSTSGTSDDSRRAAALGQSREWWPSAATGLGEVAIFPGVELRQYTLTPLLAPWTIAMLSLVAPRPRTVDTGRFHPALVVAWDSFAHIFGEESQEPDEVEPERRNASSILFGAPPGLDATPADVPAFDDRTEWIGQDTSQFLSESTWFAGLLAPDTDVPLLSGPIRSLLAAAPGGSPSAPANTSTSEIGGAARTYLERLETNLTPAPDVVAAFGAKASALERVALSDDARGLAAYVLRVVEAVTSVAESAGEFAAHLFPDESPEVDSSVDLLVALRLAAVVAWMDAVGIWVVSAAAIPLAPSISEHVAPPPGHRAPATLVEEVVAAMPDRYTIEEYRAVLEQLEAQWDELAVLDDEGPPDFNEDWQGVVDVDGFALREERSL